jgi:hypothetical protein
VIGDDEFDDPALMRRRQRDHERMDGVLAGRVGAENAELSAIGHPSLVDTLLTPLNRLATKRFLREAREKVWHNAIELHRARVRGPRQLTARVAELEVICAAKVADLLRPGQVLLRLAVAGFGVTLPPPVD